MYQFKQTNKTKKNNLWTTFYHGAQVVTTKAMKLPDLRFERELEVVPKAS